MTNKIFSIKIIKIFKLFDKSYKPFSSDVFIGTCFISTKCFNMEIFPLFNDSSNRDLYRIIVIELVHDRVPNSSGSGPQI